MMDYQSYYREITGAIRSKAREILPNGARVVLYGSRARGYYQEKSDWDLHILIPGEGQLPLDKVIDFSYPLDILGWNYGIDISTMIFTYGEWERRKLMPFYENVEKDKIIILD